MCYAILRAKRAIITYLTILRYLSTNFSLSVLDNEEKLDKLCRFLDVYTRVDISNWSWAMLVALKDMIEEHKSCLMHHST